MNNIDVSLICKALSDANRLKIVEMLMTGEKCACRLLDAFCITQPTLSHHMKVLCECALVKARKKGKWSFYSLNCERWRDFQKYIEDISCYCNENEQSDLCCD